MKVIDLIKVSENELEDVSNVPILEAKWYLSEILGEDVSTIALLFDDEVGSEVIDEYYDFIKRRKTGEPFHYITGHREFYGIDFKLSPDVLIPRPDTEVLVETALSYINKNHYREGYEVGLGSGAISVSLLHQVSDLSMTAVDISAKAIEVAKENAVLNGVDDRLSIHEADIVYGGNKTFDFIISNPPYIPMDEYDKLPNSIKSFEPRIALLAANDGIEFYVRIIEDLFSYLKSGGYIFLEIGCTQATKVSKIINDNGFINIQVVRDYAGKDRVVYAEKR